MIKSLFLFVLPIIANAQCGLLVVNPITGQLDCTGTFSTVASCSFMTGIVVTANSTCTIDHNLNLSSPYTPSSIGASDSNGGVSISPILYGPTWLSFIPLSNDTVTMSICGVSSGGGTPINGPTSCCSIVPSTLGPYTNSQVVSQTFTTTNCPSGQTFNFTGQPPTGLSISGNVLSGTISGTSTLPFKLATNYGQLASTNYSITVNSVPGITACGSGPVSGGAATCDDGTPSTPYSETITTSGGTGAITCTPGSGFPSWATMIGCSFSGTPTTTTTYTFTVTPIDSNGISGSSITMTLVVANAFMTGTSTYAGGSPPTVNLTSIGTSDWQHYGGTSGSPSCATNFGLNSFSPLAGLIGTLSTSGLGGLNYSNDPRVMSWSNGTPNTSDSGNQTGCYNTTNGGYYQITLPASSTIVHTAYLYFGGCCAASSTLLTATLSDGSAGPYTSSACAPPAATGWSCNWTIQYKSATNGQTLTIKWQNNSGGSSNIDISAVALQ